MTKQKWGLFVIFLFSGVLGGFFMINDTLPLKYEGKAFVGSLFGEMVVGQNDTLFMLEWSRMPRIEFADFEPPAPEDFDSFIPPLKEEWMGDIKERSKRATISFSRLELGNESHNPELIFKNYGQYRYLWMNNSKNRIKVLIGWDDNHKDELHYPTLWASDNGGVSFYQQTSFVERGNVKDKGIFFSESGQFGYIFIDDYILGTKDYGASWIKIDYSQLPYKVTVGLQLPIETASVDKEGNLYILLYKDNNSFIYKIKPGTQIVDNKPEKIIYNKLLLSFNALSNNDYHYFYVDCNNPDCHSIYTKYLYTYAYAKTPLSQPTSLKFSYLDHQGIEYQYTFDFLYEIKQVYTDKNKIAVTLFIPNTKKHLLITSTNYGKNWEIYDLNNKNISADYFDIEAEKYWIHNYRGQIYSLSNVFKRKIE